MSTIVGKLSGARRLAPTPSGRRRASVLGAALILGALDARPTFAQPHYGSAAKATRRRADTAMAKEMEALRSAIEDLKGQMAHIARSADPQERRRLMVQHLRDSRQTLTRMHAMELEMVDQVRRGRMVSDTNLRERQELLAEQSAMLLEMLDQAARHAEGACP